MSAQGSDGFAAFDIPQLHDVVRTPAGKKIAGWMKRNATNFPLMTLQILHDLTTHHNRILVWTKIPQSHETICAATRQQLARGVKTHKADHVDVSLERIKRMAALHIP